MIEFVTLPDGEIVRKESILSVGTLRWSERNDGKFDKYKFVIIRANPERDNENIYDSYSNKSLEILNTLRNRFISQLNQATHSLNDIELGWIKENGS